MTLKGLNQNLYTEIYLNYLYQTEMKKATTLFTLKGLNQNLYTEIYLNYLNQTEMKKNPTLFNCPPFW